MKIAYLILAHNNPNHFRRLLLALKGCDVFVFVDAKADIKLFKTADVADNVVFIQQRIKVHWGGYSILEATFSLLQCAMQNNTAFDYYCLLSGNCYPLRSPDFIKNYIGQRRGTEFIRYHCMDAATQILRLAEYNYEKFFKYHLYIVGHKQNMLQMWRVIRYLYSKILQLYCKIFTRNYQQIFQTKNFYRGSAWWVLSDDAVRYFFEAINADNAKIKRFLKYTHVTDEVIFQTILVNSSFKNNIKNTLTFTDWLAGGSHPEVITQTHIRDLVKQKNKSADDNQYLFARKFPDDSEDLVVAIHKNLW